jgi:hypothetical protein
MPIECNVYCKNIVLFYRDTKDGLTRVSMHISSLEFIFNETIRKMFLMSRHYSDTVY